MLTSMDQLELPLYFNSDIHNMFDDGTLIHTLHVIYLQCQIICYQYI